MRKILLMLLVLGLVLAACGGGGGDEAADSEQGETEGEAVSSEAAATGAGLLATDPDSLAVVTTLAGSGEAGSEDGAGESATFTQPADVTVGPDGNVYAIEFRGRRVTRITPDGQVTTLLLSPGTGDKDGPASEARVGTLRSLVVVDDGTVYFSDWESKKFKKLTPDGQVSTVAETGFLEDLLLMPDGTILAPAGSFREYVMQITQEGETSAFAGQRASAGVADGPADVVKFANLSGIASDAAGNIYVSQGISLRQKAGDHVIRMIAPDGTASTIAGQRFQEGYLDGFGLDAQFAFPSALAAAPDGTLFVADSVNNCVRRVGPGPDYEVTTVAGACGQAGDLVDGEGESARFKSPQGLHLTEDGVLYVADSLNNAIRVITFQ